jgi:hypothetical protein
VTAEISFIYSPALRAKQGEFRALNRLPAPVADLVLPLFVAPPPKDRDPEKKRKLTLDEIIHWTGARIGKHWPRRLALLDPRYLFTAFGEQNSAEWLPRLFWVARHANAYVVPVMTLGDVVGVRGDASSRSVDRDAKVHLALRVMSGEIDSSLAGRVQHLVGRFGLTLDKCVLVLDFADADFSSVDQAAEVLAASFETAHSIGRWLAMVFQGTHYPEQNPATEGLSVEIPRNEWKTWSRAAQADQNLLQNLVFGDYGADSAKFVFRNGGGMPIRHLRYATSDCWVVARGKADEVQDVAMKDVAGLILRTGKFAGRTSSSADQQIFNIWRGSEGPGNASTWREINMLKHMTQVIADLAPLKGFALKPYAARDAATQLEFLIPNE